MASDGGRGGGGGESEDFAKTIKEIMKLPENLVCSDCDAKDPDWASINLGLFMCIKCSGVHRNLGVQISQVRSVDLDTACWTAELCGFMRSRGNVACRKVFEQFAPMYYVRPIETDSPLVRENWIRAKYVRREFCASSDDSKKESNPCVIRMPERLKEGWLTKANKKGVWQKRWFVLIGRFLEYYKTPDSTTPKGSLDLSTISLKVPDNPDPAHRFAWEVKSTKKSYPMCADKEEDMFGWLHAIRRANVYYYTTDADAKERGAEVRRPAPAVPLALGKIGKAMAVGVLQYSGGGMFGMWGPRYAAVGSASNALYLYKPGAEGKAPADTAMPDVTIALDQTEVQDVSLKLQRKFAFGVYKVGRIHWFQAASQEQLVEFTGALLTSIDAHNERADFDFQKNCVHTPITPASPKAKSAATAAAGARPSGGAVGGAAAAATPKAKTSGAVESASPTSSSASSADGKSAPNSPSAGAAPAPAVAAAAGAGAGKSAPPIPAKGSKPAPPIPRASKPAVAAVSPKASGAPAAADG